MMSRSDVVINRYIRMKEIDVMSDIQKICPSCMDELNNSGGPVDEDALSLVTDEVECDYHNA